VIYPHEDCLPLATPVLVDGVSVGTVGALDLEALKKFASPAPFGRGSENVVDEKVRRALEIKADRITFLKETDRWTQERDTLPKILNNAFRSSSLEGKDCSFQFVPYKLHIYEKGGGFFEYHRDTIHSPNHRATGILVFPYKHKGGDLLIKVGAGPPFCFKSDSNCDKLQSIRFYTGQSC